MRGPLEGIKTAFELNLKVQDNLTMNSTPTILALSLLMNNRPVIYQSISGGGCYLFLGHLEAMNYLEEYFYNFIRSDSFT